MLFVEIHKWYGVFFVQVYKHNKKQKFFQKSCHKHTANHVN